MDLDNIFTDWKTDKLDKIESDELQPFFNEYEKINIYNFGKPVPLQKIWLRLPNLKVVQPTYQPDKKKSKGYISLQLFIYMIDPIIKKFYFFIRRLEKLVKNLLINEYNLTDIKLKSSLRKIKDNYVILSLKMPYIIKDDTFKFDFNIYNEKNRKIDINMNTICAGSYASTIVELSEVWIHNNEFAFNFNVMQMKITPEFNFSKCLFLEDGETEVEEEEVKVTVKVEPVHKYNNIKPRVEIKKEITKGHYVPTVADLLSIKLKPVNKV